MHREREGRGEKVTPNLSSVPQMFENTTYTHEGDFLGP